MNHDIKYYSNNESSNECNCGHSESLNNLGRVVNRSLSPLVLVEQLEIADLQEQLRSFKIFRVRWDGGHCDQKGSLNTISISGILHSRGLSTLSNCSKSVVTSIVRII